MERARKALKAAVEIYGGMYHFTDPPKCVILIRQICRPFSHLFGAKSSNVHVVVMQCLNEKALSESELLK